MHSPSENTFCLSGVRRRKGFTLIELLAVVAMLALLVTLLVPTIKKSFETANRSKCAHNLNQIGIGIMAYAHDNQMMLPQPYGVNFPYYTKAAGNAEDDRLKGVAVYILPYLSPRGIEDINNISVVKIFFCPSGYNQFENYWKNYGAKSSGYSQYCGFSISDKTNKSGYDNSRASLLEGPEVSDLLCMDISADDNSQYANHHDNDGRLIGANALFKDGSVRWLTADKLTYKLTKLGVKFKFPDPYAKNY